MRLAARSATPSAAGSRNDVLFSVRVAGSSGAGWAVMTAQPGRPGRRCRVPIVWSRCAWSRGAGSRGSGCRMRPVRGWRPGRGWLSCPSGLDFRDLPVADGDGPDGGEQAGDGEAGLVDVEAGHEVPEPAADVQFAG